LGIRQEKNATNQITLSFYRQISTIAADLIGMIGCPSGPTRICVGPDAGPLIRGISVDRGTGFVFCFACGEIREDLCARCAQGIAVKGQSPTVTY